jgi:hypothetical protein
LNTNTAAKLISPATYNPQDSFMNTQHKKPRFASARDRGNSMIDQAIKKAHKTPGVGHYDMQSLDKAYKSTTLGLSRGWK